MNRRFFISSSSAVGGFAILSRLPSWAQPNDGKILDGTLAVSPHPNPLNDIHDKGTFECAACELPLFSSAQKFDSGTGWPSFWAPIKKENIIEEVDKTLGMVRTEVACARCEGHLGHVFDDGPKPTGLRYCMNGVAMKFVKQG